MKQVSFTKTNNNILSETIQLLLLYYYPKECYPWDDFLDFSRISSPKSRDNGRFCHSLFQVWRRRLVINMFQRFRGNYIWLWTSIVLMFGAVTEKRILIGFCLTAFSWFILCFVLTCYGRMKRRRKSIGSLSLPKNHKQCDEEPNHLFLVSVGLAMHKCASSPLFSFLF